MAIFWGYICGEPTNLKLFKTTNDKNKAASLRNYWNEVYGRPQLWLPIGGRSSDGTYRDGEMSVSRDDPLFFNAIESSFTTKRWRFKFYPDFEIQLNILYEHIY